MANVKYMRWLSNEYRVKRQMSVENPSIFIELTNHCNFNCEYCQHQLRERDRGFMCWKLFERLINEIAEWGGRRTVALAIDGEPTLYSRFCDAVRLITNKGLLANVATNGSTLWQAYYDLPCDWYISVGGNKKDWHRRGSRLAFDDYLSGIVDFVRYRSVNGIEGSVTLQLHEYLEWDNNRRTVRRDVIDKDAMKNKVQWILEQLGSIVCRGDMQLYIKPHKIVATNWRLLSNAGSVTRGYCDSAWKNCAVLWDGRLTYCCTDLSGSTYIGNVNDEPLRYLWLRSGAANLERDNWDMWIPSNSICRRCLWAITENCKLHIGEVTNG